MKGRRTRSRRRKRRKRRRRRATRRGSRGLKGQKAQDTGREEGKGREGERKIGAWRRKGWEGKEGGRGR